MNYGIYKNIRGASWQCLLDCGIDALPVPVGVLAKHYGITMLYDSDVHILSANESGRLVFDNGSPLMIINNNQSVQRMRFTAVHELGHYVLGHLGESGALSRSHIKAPQEQEADMFAARVLMPACVLWGLGVYEPQAIATICNVSLQAATYRAKRLEVLRKRNKFLSDPLERAVYNQFNKIY